MKVEYTEQGVPEHAFTWDEHIENINSIGVEETARKYVRFITWTAKESALPLTNVQIELFYADIYNDFVKILSNLELDPITGVLIKNNNLK